MMITADGELVSHDEYQLLEQAYLGIKTEQEQHLRTDTEQEQYFGTNTEQEQYFGTNTEQETETNMEQEQHLGTNTEQEQYFGTNTEQETETNMEQEPEDFVLETLKVEYESDEDELEHRDVQTPTLQLDTIQDETTSAVNSILCATEESPVKTKLDPLDSSPTTSAVNSILCATEESPVKTEVDPLDSSPTTSAVNSILCATEESPVKTVLDPLDSSPSRPYHESPTIYIEPDYAYCQQLQGTNPPEINNTPSDVTRMLLPLPGHATLNT